MNEKRRNDPELQANLFLSAVMAIEATRFVDGIESVELNSGDILVDTDTSMVKVYFPVRCIVSQVLKMENDKNVEADTVGREGFVGLPAALGSQQTLRYIVQVPGQAFCMPAALFRDALESSPELRRLTNVYVLAKLQQFAQSVACNALHGVRMRLCRWLLTCQDRVQANEFPITQKFLSQMLGVRRPTVSDAAARLQADGLLRYRRGWVVILDRTGLEKVACGCYRSIKEEYERLLG